MRKKGILRRILGHKTKTGASLMVVLVSVTLLIIMGTGFSVIAMNGYNNSHRRMCQQQAYYTATACIDLLNNDIAQNPHGNTIQHIRQKIVDSKNKYDAAHPGAPIPYTQLSIEIANIEDTNGMRVPRNPIEGELLGIMGGCKMFVQPLDEALTQLRLVSTGEYQGYTQTVSARIACTKNGAIELKKVFSNSQCWSAPIVTLVAGETTGDMYFASPGIYKRYGATADNPYAGEIDIENKFNQKLRAQVYGNVASGSTTTIKDIHTKPFDIYNKPVKTIRQRVVSQRDYDFYTNSGATFGGAYIEQTQNKVRYKLYPQGNIMPYYGAEYANFYVIPENDNYIMNANGDRVVIEQYLPAAWEEKYHIMSKDIDKIYGVTNTDIWYNDWVEIYMTTGELDGATSKPIVSGDMYVDTQALIGLFDRNKSQRKWWHYYDIAGNDQKVERKYVSYIGEDFNRSGNISYDKKYRNGRNLGDNFEHGGTGNLFYDYNDGGPSYEASTFRHNGNLYLFYDTRIECYDSFHTPNARKGIKNNIFAQHNLSIDGYVYDPSLGVANEMQDNVPGTRNVQIFGDVMCKGNLQITNAIIYGDVYCDGDELNIADSIIYGNVVHNGVHCRMDGADIRKRDFKLDNGGTMSFNGGDVIVLGNDRADNYYHDKTNAFTRYTGSSYNDEINNTVTYKDKENRNNTRIESLNIWQTVFTNCTVEGMLYSNVNTKIKTATHRDEIDKSVIDGTPRNRVDIYNDIFCTRSLYFDGLDRYLYDDSLSASSWWHDGSGDRLKQNKLVAFANNRVLVMGMVVAERLIIQQTQATDKHGLDVKMPVSYYFQFSGSNDHDCGPNYEVMKAYDAKYATKYRADNMQINYIFNDIYVGDGGFYIDGNNWIVGRADNGTNIMGAKDDNKSIEIHNLYTTAKVANLCNMWDACGGVRESGGGTGMVDLHALEGEPWRHDEAVRGVWHVSIKFYYDKTASELAKWDESVKERVVEGHAVERTTLLSSIKTTLGNYITSHGEIVLKPDGTPVKNPDGTDKRKSTFDYTTPFNSANSMQAVMEVMKDYLVDHRAVGRINKYYGKFMSHVKDEKIARLYADYKDLTLLKNWSANGEEGPFPAYDADKDEGIWRRIKVLKWYAPEYDDTGKEGVPYVDINSGSSVDLSIAELATQYPDVCTYGEIDNEQAYIIKASFRYAGKLTIPDDAKVVLDTSHGNYHIVLNKGIEFGKNSKMMQTGGHMTFFYLGVEPEYDLITDSASGRVISVPKGLYGANPMANKLFEAKEGVQIGDVIGEEVGDKRRDSIYFVSNAICHIHMGSGASLHGYMYIPYGHLLIDRVPIGKEHTVLHGSMIVRTMIVDATLPYLTIKSYYEKMKYEYEMSPLIVDGQIDYGDKNDNSGELNVFDEDSWGFVGYE